MLFLQKWEENSFEYNFLDDIKLKVIDKKIYCGFDFGFFEGINIYYGSNKDNKLAFKLYDLLKKEKIKIRLITNIDYDFDLIVLFGYINLKKERKRVKKNKQKILKALTSL